MPTETMPKRIKQHTVYKNSEGVRVPGVTTALHCVSIGNKTNILIKWANNLGLQGINSESYKDELGIIGGLAHELIMAKIQGQAVEFSEYSPMQVEKAQRCYHKFKEWSKANQMKLLLVEKPLVSDEHGFGGTPDCLAIINKEVVLLDWKTGFIAKEHYVQGCAYRHLAIENDFPPAQQLRIVSFPRTEDEKFQEYTYTEFDTGWQIFLNALNIYQLQKRI